MARTDERPAQRGKRPHPIEWTAAEQALFRDLYPRATKQEILAALPRRTWVGLGRYAYKLQVKRTCDGRLPWTDAENEVLREHYNKLSRTDLALKLNRSWQSVKMAATRLGLSKPRALSRQEKEERDAAARMARLQKIEAKQKAKGRKAKQRAVPVVAKPKPKPAPKPVVIAPEPVKRSPATPILNARVEQRRLADKQREQKPKPFVTADQIRSLSASHPARQAWTRAAYHGPQAATDAFYAAMQQYPQAA
jgi:hypothetical protein